MHSCLLLCLYIIWLLTYIFIWSTGSVSHYPRICAVLYRKVYFNLTIAYKFAFACARNKNSCLLSGQLRAALAHGVEILVFPKVRGTSSGNSSWRKKGEVLEANTPPKLIRTVRRKGLLKLNADFIQIEGKKNCRTNS